MDTMRMTLLPEPRTGVGLVTTAWLATREPDGRHMQVLTAFLLYHIEIGIDRIFLFLDDADEHELVLDHRVQHLVLTGQLEVFYATQSHVKAADGSVVCAYQAPHHRRPSTAAQRDTDDVVARQLCHMDVAMQRCVALAPTLRWLLHLDMDELFFCQGFRDHHSVAPRAALAAWVAALDTHSCDHLAIINYEAVPTQLHGGNFFVSATRFRRHTARIPLHAGAQDALRFWQRRTPFGQFFLFYDNGKPIVRVSRDVAAASVHHWRSTRVDWEATANFYDPRIGHGGSAKAPWIPTDEQLQRRNR
ncbi:hypothetical protein P43SY_001097 [Pythium insidiosum]|uniref:Glycosyltransferase family 92 protein n=1 Tax=Pythium insidiosum TaxID=114742 RepID=A0AAD5LBT1_PYTIN|nr:hypothetical protein P43SY_001097 [Pythium insidiosum]